jgi:hypothetical protein
MVVAGVLVLAVVLRERLPETLKGLPADRPSAHSAQQIVVTWNGQRWLPDGPAVQVTSAELVPAGTSEEGHPVYVRRQVSRPAELFVRLPNGRHQPLVPPPQPL